MSGYALITGASSGLGVCFAELFGRDRVPMIIVSSPRSAKTLHKLASQLSVRYGVQVEAWTYDLGAPGAARAIHQRLQEANIQLDYLVNNAGFGIVGLKVHEYDFAKLQQMLQVNVNALTELCALISPGMVKRGKGRILNVSSIAGYIVPHGLEAAYSASKAYVVSFSEAMADDLRGTGVTCTHVAPGPTRTEFFYTGGLRDTKRLSTMMMDADVVAGIGYRAMMQGRSGVIAGWSNKLVRVLVALSPSKWLLARITGRVVERKH